MLILYYLKRKYPQLINIQTILTNDIIQFNTNMSSEVFMGFDLCLVSYSGGQIFYGFLLACTFHL